VVPSEPEPGYSRTVNVTDRLPLSQFQAATGTGTTASKVRKQNSEILVLTGRTVNRRLQCSAEEENVKNSAENTMQRQKKRKCQKKKEEEDLQ
jgi:hypothetical protein